MSVKTPDFKLTIGTIDFSGDLKDRVNVIEVDMESDGASSFMVQLDDRDGCFSDGKKAVREGNSCVIELGYANNTRKLIEGIVTGVKAIRKEYERKVYVVTGFDGLQSLTRGRKRRSWEGMKDSEIAQQIANENGLEPDIEDSGIVQPYVAQNNINDLSFLFERAKRLGFEVKVEEKRLVFRKPKRTEDSEVTLSWDGTKSGECYILQRCNFNTSTMNVVKKVIVRSYDPKKASPIIGVADEIDGDKMGGKVMNAGEAAAKNNRDTTIQISDQPVRSQEEAERLAKSILNERAGNYLTGRGRCEGCNKLVCGKKIKIDDVGEENDGFYYVTSAKHTFKVGHSHGFGYWTDFTVSRTGR